MTTRAADERALAQPTAPSAVPSLARGAGPARPPCVESGQLFVEGQRELIILHQGEEYRLRITRQDKLILTK